MDFAVSASIQIQYDIVHECMHEPIICLMQFT